MFNDELNEKELNDLVNNKIIRIGLTVDQAGDIYASLMFCAEIFRNEGHPERADKLKSLGISLLTKSALSALDE